MTQVKEQKEYDHIPELLRSIVVLRLEDKGGMHKTIPLKAGDPRLISSTLATAPPPPTSQLVSEKKSRLVKTTESAE